MGLAHSISLARGLVPASPKKNEKLVVICLEWGIEINADKTKLMKFNDRYINSPSQTFTIGKHSIKEVDSYCYLGVEIHKSGSFSLARSELKKKAMRALYAMKNTVNKCKLSFRSLTTLFDNLITHPLCQSLRTSPKKQII